MFDYCREKNLVCAQEFRHETQDSRRLDLMSYVDQQPSWPNGLAEKNA